MVAVEKLVCVCLVWCCVVVQMVTSTIEEHPNVPTCKVTWCFNPQEHSQNTDQHLMHTVTSVVCCRYCVAYYLVRSCVEVVWGWQTLSPPGARCTSVLYQQEEMPNFPFCPVLSRGQSETHAAVRYLLYSSAVLGLFVVLTVVKIAFILFMRWLLKFNLM